ncbi:ionic transporter y4hA [Bordetella sp. H567]|uniref:calcium:proton antiporter n=1 Tax=Bordetella sp. H567 TaxID=1697043 RepID=UPI00081D3093|nr:ionic transporter y4hA [Bordetella sp. H567]AOB30203.1 ionic transporter y4hA [Bordetella sp. H567]
MPSETHAVSMPRSTWVYPLLALVFYFAAAAYGFATPFVASLGNAAVAVLMMVVLFGTIFAAVYHAEIIAHVTGEPYGTLVLTASVTVIEVALIVSIMIFDENGSPALARDTVFSVVMIVCTGLAGICILGGSLRFREQRYGSTGASAYLTVLIVLATLTMVLPNYVQEMQGPSYSDRQLVFVAVMTLLLYGAFLYIQTVRHRDYFITLSDHAPDENHHIGGRALAFSIVLLLVALVAVVLLSKQFANVVEFGREAIGAPPAVTGLMVAILVLLPEGISAYQSARRDELQKALNLALGSSLATIGLTFPAVSALSLALHKPLVLGLGPGDTVLMLLTLVVSIVTLGSGRTNVLYGFVHLVIFATFIFMAFLP